MLSSGQRARRNRLRGSTSLRGMGFAGLAAAATGFGVLTTGPANAQSIPVSAFQTYSAATAGSIVASPFALYSVPVDQLQPTQMNEGFTEVNSKTTGFDLLTPSQLQSNLIGDIEPVVIGPGGVLYLTDGHHTFTALEDSAYGSTNPTVFVNVIANFSTLTTAQFWATMQADDLLLPLNDGVPQIVNTATGSPIPTSLTGLTQDIYRGLEFSILKNQNSKLFTTSSNISGAAGAVVGAGALDGDAGKSEPGIDKETGLYADFINADAYRNANGGLGLPYLSPGDIQIATKWNLTATNPTVEPNVPVNSQISGPVGANVEVGQLPGFILSNNIVVNGTISNTTLANGTLDGTATGTFNQTSSFASFKGITQFNLGTPSNPILVGQAQSGFVMQLGNDSGFSVTLSGTNTYTGGTTITAGNLIVGSDAALGATPTLTNAQFNSSLTLNSLGFPTNALSAVQADNGIVFNSLSEGNGTLTIGTSTGGTFSTNRPIAVDSEAATINVNGNVVTLNGPLVSAGTDDIALGNADGESPLTIDDDSAGGGKTNTAGRLILSTPSPFFYGNIIIGNNGTPTVEAMNDAALGNTTLPANEIGQIELNGGTLQTGASFSAPERNIFLGGGSQIDVDGNATTWGTLTDVKRTIAIGNSNTTTPGAITFNNFTISQTATLQLDGAANGVTYNGAETVTFTNGILQTATSDTLLINSAVLGSTAKVFSGVGSQTLVNGMAPAWMISDTGGSAGTNPYNFLTYSNTNGYVAVTYTDTGSGSTGGIRTATSTSIVDQTGNGTLAANAAAYALKVNDGAVITATGFTITLGDGTDPAGLIMGGGSAAINGGTLAFGGSQAIIYAKGSSTITSAITGSNGLTVAGSGTLTLSPTAPLTSLSGPITIDSGTLSLTTANVFASDVSGLTLDDVKSSPSNSILNFTASQAFSTLNSVGSKSAITYSGAGVALTIGDLNNLSSTLSSAITQSGNAVTGALTKNGTGLVDISGAAVSLFAGSTVAVNAGVLRIGNGVFSSSATNVITVALGAELQYSGNGGSVFNDPIQGSGDFHLVAGTVQLTGTNTYNGGTVIETGATLDVTTANLPTGGAISNAGGMLVFDQSVNGTFSGVMSDGKQSGGPSDPNDVACTQVTCTGPNLSGTLIRDDSATGGATASNVTISNVQAYTGMTYIEAGTLTLGATNTIATSQGVVLGRVGGAMCAGVACSTSLTTAILALGANNTIAGLADDAGNKTQVQLNGNTLTLAPIAGSSWSYAGSIVDETTSGNLVQNGPGTSILTGTSTYTGTTTVGAGTLDVEGKLTGTSSVAVNSGGTIVGGGTIDPALMTINSGGTFAPGTPGTPGTSTTVAGNLLFNAGANYIVQLNSTSTTFANVSNSGTAALNGNVLAAFALGTNPLKQYEILESSGLGGTTFSSLATVNLPNFNANLTYNANDVFLNLSAAMGNGGGLPGNQQNVANSLNNFFNNGGTLPPNFLTIFGLSGGNLNTALAQLSGESNTAADQASFQMMTNFLGIMVDPSVDGRGGSGGSGGSASAFAPEREAELPPDIALAYASVLKKAPPAPPAFEDRWSAWGSSFGGANKIDGDPSAGTNSVTARVFGFAGGLDYHVTPGSVIGFALAGAGSNWSLAQNLGTGRTDSFQFGLYGTSRLGPAYVSASAAFADHGVNTDRIAALGDHLDARFNAQSYGARLETGYRYGMTAVGVTPYAALQTQLFHTPNYSETDLSGGGFGLSYAAANPTDTRSELGSRFDNLQIVNGIPLILRARVAWVHDWVSTPSLAATFQTLPGANFVVNGAALPANSALTSAGAELRLTQNWSLLANFDGEFAKTAQSYAGTGTVRYVW
jgi:fibronectin-binding autotransporter adhesin